MAVYTIKDETLTNIADAIREKNRASGSIIANVSDNTHPFITGVQYKIIFNFTVGNTMVNCGIRISVKNNITGQSYYLQENLRIFEDGEVVEYDFISPFTGMGSIQIGITSYATKTYADYIIMGGEKTYTPNEMSEAINELTILPQKTKVLTGDISNMFCNKHWGWFMRLEGLETKDLTNSHQCFYNRSEIAYIPFSLNFDKNTNADISHTFTGTSIKIPPTMKNVKPSSTHLLFYNCDYLTSVPEDYMDTWDMSYIQTYSYGQMNSMFMNCCRLRTIPTKILSQLWGNQGHSYSFLYYAFFMCYSLDEVIGIEPGDGTWSSNAFSYTFYNNWHLKNCIFATNEDGTPKTVKWKSQTINLSISTGYGNLLDYGFTKDTQIIDDESYQRLKDHPDAWTKLVKYSRYNHDSAVRTINSLPDTSTYLATAGGTNTIKFYSGMGSATDGGAISNLTEEEIAVATAKGWTVSLV